ncbi:hypothetical protein [Actinokineospora sp.]|uniref:hypothetical protein n=1 Tax=Actinokineospora sp. TaxID=1872133 RepID=UPI003D6B4341
MTAPRKRRTTPASRRRSTTARRRRRSTATTLGGAVGAALAGVLTALIGTLPLWVWALLLVVGFAVGYLMHRRAHPAA